MSSTTNTSATWDPSNGDKAVPLPAAPDVFAPARLGPLTLRNRIIKAATFEAMSPRREVTDNLIDFHRAVAAGGVGMTTVAYCAVTREGSTDGRTLVLTDDAVPGLQRLTDAVHEEGAAIAAQIGHAGPVANPAGTKAPALSPSRLLFAPGMRPTKACTDADIARVTEDFRAGTRRAVAAGFDALEVHLGHNYLLSSFLSPRLNRRTDQWGGSVEARSRFPRQVLAAVREEAGDHVAVTAKFNMDDGAPGGLWLDESVQIAQLIEADGTVDALELTGGSSLRNPMYLFRGEAPRAEMAATLPPSIRPGFKLIAKRFLKEYPFEEAYFLPAARQFRAALDLPLILLGGINRLDTMQLAMAEGFAFVAMARALLREPDLPRKLQDGSRADGLCVHCNRCMPTTYSRTHCVLIESPGL